AVSSLIAALYRARLLLFILSPKFAMNEIITFLIRWPNSVCHYKDTNHPDAMTKAQYWRLYELHKHVKSDTAEEHKKRGKKLSVWERFNKSKLVELYNGYYSVLSMYSHGNVGALVENSVGEQVLLGSAFNDEKSLQYFDQAINLVALSIKDTLVFYNFDFASVEYPTKIIDKINKAL
ncbi:hypothetical protein, partial [Shewanella oncorhynchi]|uniref:hypothetical protein n=1 Tax=Shewanella oncorhynchi TaxID=2726434 RepID=UPI003D79CE5F